MEPEIALAGGRSRRAVVRIGDTVRRWPNANAGFVRGLLGHLEAAGFAGAPRWLGTDEKGREIFSFIEGDVPPDLGRFDDPILAGAARFIRSYHDATAPLFAAGRVACHNDLSPCNFVCRGGVPSAIIDFDLAAEGERLFDLGYAAWLWLDIGNEEDHAPAEQVRRLAAFAAAYDKAIDLGALVDAMLLRQRLLADDHFGGAGAETRRWAAACGAATLRLRALVTGQSS